METCKRVYSTSKNFLSDGDVIAASLIMGFAYFAGKNRSVKIFESANPRGLMTAAGGVNVGLLSVKMKDRSSSESAATLVHKTFLMFVCCNVMTPVVAKAYKNKCVILPQDVWMFSLVSVCLKWGQTGAFLKIENRNKTKQKPDKKSSEIETNFVPLKELPKHWKESSMKLSKSVHEFDFDGIVEKLSTTNITNSLSTLRTLNAPINGERPCKEEDISFLIRKLDMMSDTPQERDFLWYFNKVVGLLYEQKVLMNDNPPPPFYFEGSVEGFVSQLFSKMGASFAKPEAPIQKNLFKLIKKVITDIKDALKDCVDQQLSRMRVVAIEVLESRGTASSESMRLSLEIEKYRTELIQTCVARTNYTHAADVEIELAFFIQKALKLPVSRLYREGACFKREARNDVVAEAAFEFRALYYPLTFLIEKLKYNKKGPYGVYHDLPAIHTNMCLWFRKCAYVELAELPSKTNPLNTQQDEKLEEEFGCDFNCDVTSYNEKAIYTYLFSHGFITI